MFSHKKSRKLCIMFTELRFGVVQQENGVTCTRCGNSSGFNPTRLSITSPFSLPPVILVHLVSAHFFKVLRNRSNYIFTYYACISFSTCAYDLANIGSCVCCRNKWCGGSFPFVHALHFQ